MHNSHAKEVTQILLDAGANLFIKDHYGMTARKHARDESKQLLKKAEDKYKHKAMKFGAIVGITAGMEVGSGLFAAAGLSLLISAFIVAAVCIAIGFVVFRITYKMSKPSGNVDNVDLLSEEIYASLGV